MDWILNGIESKVIGLAVNQSFFESSASHPDTIGSVVVISTVVSTLDHRGPPELATPDYQSIFEHPESL
jgi:hypothetical protein